MTRTAVSYGANSIVDRLTGVVPAWRVHGACRDHPTVLFFPGRGEDAGPAQEICAGCPVRDECLEWALTLPERFGVWGGMSERARRRMRAARGLDDDDRHGTLTGYNEDGCRCDECRAAKAEHDRRRRQRRSA